jgi:Uma2 family endonuclease
MITSCSTHTTTQKYLQNEFEGEEKYEYFNGKVVVMPAARKLHGRIVANLIGEIGAFIKYKDYDVFGNGCRVVTATSNAYMFPDVSIICGEFQKQDDEFESCINPSVVIEVMDDYTRNKDQGYKFFYYIQIPSLQEYILVDSTANFVHSMHKQSDDSWKFEKMDNVNSFITIHSIGLSISFDDIYDKVAFV